MKNYVLNEKAGVIEFDNIKYRNLICQIANDIKSSNIFDYKLNFNELKDYKFAKYTYNFSNVLSWLANLNIYYAISKNGYFNAQSIKSNNEYGDFIYIIDNGEENLTYVLFHEMCHLYDYSQFKEIWFEDEKYFFMHNADYDINNYNLLSNVNDFSINDMHNIIIESMYYANFTESHAFMENINFEMFEYLNKKKKMFYVFQKIDEIFYRTSKTLYCIYIMHKIISDLRYIENDKKLAYMLKYKNEINKAYHDFNTFDKLINYIYKKLHKIISHSRSLFNYYYNLDSIAKQMHELNENEKNLFIRSWSSESHSKRLIPDDI